MDAEAALDLIKRETISGLGGFDGCLCTGFEVQGVNVDVSCRKSSGSRDFRGTLVRVYTTHLDSDREGLAAIANEVARQLRDEFSDGSSPIKTRFTDWRHDNEKICVYCDEPRAEESGYLCEACLVRDDGIWGNVAETHDFRKYEVILPAKTE